MLKNDAENLKKELDAIGKRIVELRRHLRHNIKEPGRNSGFAKK